MERGLDLFFQGLQSEMEPALRDLSGAMDELGPAVTELLEMVDDITNYEMPEMLDNGDIIIRRKPDAPAIPPQGTDI